MKRLFPIGTLLALVLGAAAMTNAPARGQSAATPPPSPPPIEAAPTASPVPAPPVSPAATTVPAASRGKATPTPAPPKEEGRVGISGVWEVQIQSDNATRYTHFKLAQKENVLTGTYMDTNGKRYPLAGSVDGQNVRIVVSMPDGSTLTFVGQVDGTTDMIGMLTTQKAQLAFTAAYRPKYKFIDNINPGAPGLGP